MVSHATSLTKLRHGSHNTMQPVTATRRITDVETVHGEAVMLKISIRTRRLRLNRLAKVQRPLDVLLLHC